MNTVEGRKTSLTTFDFGTPQDTESEEGVLSRIFDKVISAVTGPAALTDSSHSVRSQPDTASLFSTTSNKRDDASVRSDQLAVPNTSVSTNSTLSRHLTTASTTSSTTTHSKGNHFPVSLHQDPRASTSTTATTNTTVTVGNQKMNSSQASESNKSIHPQSNVQFALPASSRKSQEESRASLDFLLNYPLTKRRSIDSDTQSVMTNFSISRSNSLSRILARLRGHKSDKEFWMPDEQCKECYKCRKQFTLLRRKHHCRTCGQIFCGRCASHIISGKLQHKQKGQVRVCNFCYAEQLLQENVSSVTVDSQQLDYTPIQHGDSPIIPYQKPPLAVPKMQIPTTALRQTRSTYGNEDTTMFALEIPTHGSDAYLSGSPKLSNMMLDRPHPLATTSNELFPDSPSMSHSNLPVPTITTTNETGGFKRLLDAGNFLLKSSGSRPRSNTSSSMPTEDARYFQQLQQQQPPQSPAAAAFNRPVQHPAFSYLQDRGGGTVLAESELSPFPGKSNQDHYYERNSHIPPAPPPPPPPPPPPSFLAFAHHQKSSYSDHLSSGSTGNMHEMTGSGDESYDRLRVKRAEELRGSGSSGNSSNKRLLRNSMIRINTASLPKSDYQMNEAWSPNTPLSGFPTTAGNNEPLLQAPQPESSLSTNSVMTMSRLNRLLPPTRQRRLSGPPQTIELSQSARAHARKILGQLMEEVDLKEKRKTEWEDVIMNILLKVANHVQPDIRSGDDMDLRHYVKIKKVPGGTPSDSFYVKGVMCTKNVAHKRMMKNIAHPRILILLFSLDYSRVEMENQLLSIAPVISQEKDHIRKLINRIVALKPSLLLIKSTVSRLALEFLLEANIPVIHNVKHSVIEAVARCTQASVVTSVDKLQHGLSFGRCESFEIRTVMHEWIPNRRKTFLIFDDCAPELGGTIVLRGEKDETLRSIKRIIDFMVFVVNNLKLETSLLLDSFAKSRHCAEDTEHDERHRSPLISGTAKCTESIHSVMTHDGEEEETVNSQYITDLLKLYQNTVLSVSQFETVPPPYLLMALKETEDKLALINVQKRRKSISGSSIMTNTTTVRDSSTMPLSASPTKSTFERQSIHSADPSTSRMDNWDHHQRIHDQDMVLEAEYDLLTKNHQISRAWDAYIGANPESISPFYHQNIVVLYSSVCTVTTVPCQGPEIRIFNFYRLPSDKTLGQYIMDLCNDAGQPCSSMMCSHPMLEHYRSYAHGNARVNVMIEPFACPLPGMQDKLLMWSYCKECNKPTPVLPVSENTWNYSFGKFLEIFLYQKGVYCRADICPHDMAKNHVRYFGYMNLTVRFQYDPIELLEMSVPPMKLLIVSQVQMDIKDAELSLLRSKINKFYQSIIDRNKAFPFDLVDPRKLEACKSELQELSTEALGEKKDVLQLVQNVYATSDPYDTLLINGVRKNLFQVVHHWEALYTDFVRFYLQPERELKKITTNQLKRMFPTEISDAAISVMDNERTKRATEVTDLPLLGIGLDGEDDDALIGHIDKRKTAATQSDELKSTSDMIFPQLSCSPCSDDTQEYDSENGIDQPHALDPNHKPFSVRPEIKRRLSLELLHELNAKSKLLEDTNARGIESLNRMASNKFLRVKSPGALSAAFTPSRIPIKASGRNSVSSTPPLYEPFNRRQRGKLTTYLGATATPGTDYFSQPVGHSTKHKVSQKKTASKTKETDENNSRMPRSITTVAMPKTRHHRHHSIGHSQLLSHNSLFDQLRLRYGNDDDDDDEEVDDQNNTAGGFLKRSVTTRGDRRFRSRLPRKKTYIQVYTQANDLVEEDIDDEFYPGGDQTDNMSIVSTRRNTYNPRAESSSNNRYKGQRFTVHSRLGQLQDNGAEADNDDNDISGDSDDASDRGIDYFSSLAPYTHKVIEGAAAVLAAENEMETVVNHQTASPPNGLQQNYSFAKSYFPFSDGHMDASSGLSNDEEDERNLPSASELLMVHQHSDNMTLSGLHNIHPDIIADDGKVQSTAERTRAAIAEALEDGRHSPEKISFMKTLTNFLTDSGVGNLLPLESPLLPTEHLFPDSYVVVREDEPSSIIAYTLSSIEYLEKMHDIQECSSDTQSNDGTIKPGDASLADMNPISETVGDSSLHPPLAPDAIKETLLRESGTHMRYNFSTGSTKFFCKIFFSEQFDALRRNCGCDESYIMSLASCLKWDSSGGKSGSAFLKTKDDRLLMKQMSRYELDAFLGFAPAYFQHMSQAFFRELPTVLAKIFGFYSIGYKNSVTGKSMRMDVLVMENLFYQRNVKKIFDLKGSLRNRHVQSTGKQDEVLLDENLVELIFESPLFIRTHSKELLRSSLHNDTLFLSNGNVMDYSLLVGIDEERQELVVGIVDFIRTFTWDKKLESWVKESGILGGGGKGPTIVSPRQYRIRFREAMERYFLMVPDYWALTRQNQSAYSALHHHQQSSESDDEYY